MHDALKSFDGNPPATGATIDAAQAEFCTALPIDYVEFLRTANGGAGPIGETGYLQIWRVEELKALNEAYAVDEFAPGLILFGSNGGGTAYAFDTRLDMAILDIPFMGLDRTEAQVLATNFSLFLDLLGTQ